MTATKVVEKVGGIEVDVLNPSGNTWTHPAACYPTIGVVDAEDGLLTSSHRKAVAIVGFSGTSRMSVPFHDKDYEIWGLNQLYRHIPRADRWFDIHSNYDEHVVDGTDHIGWITNAAIPVYLNEAHPEYPTSVRFPIEKTMAFFAQVGHFQFDYYTSSIAYMLALAIMEGFETIAIYGVDMIAGTEYADQKPCVEYYLGYAAARGIKIELPANSALLRQQHRYGYTQTQPSIVTYEDYVVRKTNIDSKRRQLEIQIAILDGASQEDAYWGNIYKLRERGGDIKINAD